MNRHTKRMLATILLAILFGVSGVISSTAGAVLGLPGVQNPPAETVENP